MLRADVNPDWPCLLDDHDSTQLRLRNMRKGSSVLGNTRVLNRANVGETARDGTKIGNTINDPSAGKTFSTGRPGQLHGLPLGWTRSARLGLPILPLLDRSRSSALQRCMLTRRLALASPRKNVKCGSRQAPVRRKLMPPDAVIEMGAGPEAMVI